MLRSGTLRHRITLQRKTGGVDGWDTPLPEAWEDVAKVWANVRHQSGAESIKAGADVSIVRASIRLRWREGLNAGMRVLYAGAVYDIEAVLPGGGRQYIDLVCRILPIHDSPASPPSPGGGGWG